ncbi:hypothetical protein U0070_015245 [Myodes glareolus]|uniref:Uncharacterized protein n=1 Tax=Myodes glareolus TaxID=447135 RepID=A0AAW0JYW6_MYOGA
MAVWPGFPYDKSFSEMIHEHMDILRKGLLMDAHPKSKRVFTKVPACSVVAVELSMWFVADIIIV